MLVEMEPHYINYDYGTSNTAESIEDCVELCKQQDDCVHIVYFNKAYADKPAKGCYTQIKLLVNSGVPKRSESTALSLKSKLFY